MLTQNFHLFIGKRTPCLKYFSASSITYQIPYTPWRSLLYVPVNNNKKVSKILKLGADSICLDCEDGWALNMKEAARNIIRTIVSVKFGRSECSVKVNSDDSGVCEEDLKVVLG